MWCALALLVLQTFGGITGYLCRCGGQESVTLTDHCHGPHSEDCHEDSSSQPACSPDDDSCADQQQHELVRTEVELIQSSDVSAPELLPVLLSVLQDPPFLVLRTEDVHLTVSWLNISPTPPPSIVVGRTTVLLV